MLTLATSCNVPRYDYCYDEDVYVRGIYSHSERRCGYYVDGGKVDEEVTIIDGDSIQDMPKYNGWCAYALAKGELVPSDPDIFLIEDGEKIYFYDRWTRFLYKNWKGAKELAEMHWETLKTEGLKTSGLQR